MSSPSPKAKARGWEERAVPLSPLFLRFCAVLRRAESILEKTNQDWTREVEVAVTGLGRASRELEKGKGGLDNVASLS